MIKEIFATLLLSGSIGAKTQTIKEPRKLDTDIINVYGNYNFKNSVADMKVFGPTSMP